MFGLVNSCGVRELAEKPHSSRRAGRTGHPTSVLWGLHLLLRDSARGCCFSLLVATFAVRLLRLAGGARGLPFLE